jgi:hypothetical protein
MDRVAASGSPRSSGFAGDLDAMELLFTSLLVQAVSAMLQAAAPSSFEPYGSRRLGVTRRDSRRAGK